jgi:predicted MFS family arabinose efflux permease
MTMGCVGSVTGLGVLPALLSLLPWRVVAALVTAPTLVVSLLLLRVQAPRRDSAVSAGDLARRFTAAFRRVPSILGRLEFWVMFLPSMLWTGTQFAVLTWLPRYARDVLEMPTAAVGILPALVPLGQAVGSAALGHLHSRHPAIGLPLFFGSSVGYVLGLVLLATGVASLAGPLAIYALVLCIGLLYGSYFVALAWIAEAVEPGLLGTASGVMNALGFIPAFVLPWLMGALMDGVDQPTSPAWQYSADAYSAAFAVTALALAAGLVGSGLVALLSQRRAGRTRTGWAR